MSTSQPECAYYKCEDAGRLRGDGFPPVCDFHLEQMHKRRQAAINRGKGRGASTKKASAKKASAKKVKPVILPAREKDKETAVAKGQRLIGRCVQLNEMTGEVVGCRSLHYRPSLKVELENGAEMEMHVPLIEQGIRKYDILLKAFDATAAFHSAAEVAAIAKEAGVSCQQLAKHVARFGDVRAKTVVFLKTVKQGGVLKASVPTPQCSVYALGTADPPRLYLGARNYLAAARKMAKAVGASAVYAGARDDGATHYPLPLLRSLAKGAVRKPVPAPALSAAKLASDVIGGAAAGTDTVCEGKAEACGKTVGTVEGVDGAKTESDDHKRGLNEEDGDGEGGVKKKPRQDAAGAGKGTAGTIYKG